MRPADAERELARIEESIQFGQKLKLEVHAGHGLNYQNIGSIAALPYIRSFQIGHSIVCHALHVGLPEAVRQMKALIANAQAKR